MESLSLLQAATTDPMHHDQRAHVLQLRPDAAKLAN